jgi:hypothetical protein
VIVAGAGIEAVQGRVAVPSRFILKTAPQNVAQEAVVAPKMKPLEIVRPDGSSPVASSNV